MHAQINTDIYVLRKEDVIRMVERYPIIRSQIMVIAEERYRMAKLREGARDAALSPGMVRASVDEDVTISKATCHIVSSLLPRDASAERGYATVSRLSVRPSVRDDQVS